MGRLVVIEGLDGSGKATQAKLLQSYLTKKGTENLMVTFPDYNNPSSTLVKLYLDGQIGGLDDVNVYAVTSFFAVDRYISYETGWKKDYLSGKTIIADRYSTSNAIYQMAKLPENKWEDYLTWFKDYEFSKLELPVPDLVIYLDVEPEVSQKLLEKRYNGDLNKRDLHEENLSYLLHCRNAAFFAAEHLGWQVVTCSQDGEMLSIDEIFNKITAILD